MTPLDLLIRVSIVLAAAWTLAALLRWRSAALRHWVLASGIVGAAVAPGVAWLVPAWHLPARAAAATPAAVPAIVVRATIDPVTPSRPQIDIVRRQTAPVIARTIGVVAIAGWIWLSGAVIALLAIIAGLARLAWIGAHSEPLDDPRWQQAHDEIGRAYGLSRSARLLQTDRPLLVTWGVRSPKILVPHGAGGWPLERIRIVIAHELAHVSRGDWLLQLAAEVVRAAHWCNPLAWIVCRRARLESEHACDDFVLNLGISGSDYASHLLDLARSMHTRRAAWVPAQAIVRPSSLERRIAAMLNARLNHAPLSRTGRTAAIVALALVTVLAAGFSAAQDTNGLSGVVADQLGHPIASVSIGLVDLTSSASRDVKSDANGRYEFSGLASGDYMMTIATPGFEKLQQRVVLSGSSLQRDVQLKLGTVHESVTITDGPPTPMPDAKRAIVESKPNPAMPDSKRILMQDKAAPGTTIPAEKRALIQKKRQDAAAQPCPTGGGCIMPPVKLGDKKPVFPDSQVGVGGIVTLKGIIDATGHVANVQVVGTANPDLAQAAIAAVSQWEFEPTLLDGQVVDTEIQISVAFKSTK